MKMNKKMLTVMVMAMMLVLVFAGCHNIVEPDSRGLVFTLSEDGAYYLLTNLGGSKDAEITVPAEYQGKPVKGIAGFTFSGVSTVTKVVISEGIEVIGNYAFDSCDKLESIVLPTSLKYIGAEAFARCSSLKSISIPKNVTSIGTLLDGMNLPVAPVESDFTSNKEYKAAYEEFSAKYLLGGASAFRACYNLATIEVDEANEVYKSVDGNLLSKDGKTFISYAFGKKRAEGYDYTFEVPAGVETIGRSAFIGCDLKKVTLPETVKTLDRLCFAYNLSLREIVFGGVVNDWSWMDKADENNKEQGQWNYGVPAKVVECEDTFCDMIGLPVADGMLYELVDDEYYVVSGIGKCIDVNLIIPSKYNYKPVKGIKDGALTNGNFVTVELLKGIESVGGRAFAHCAKLVSVVVPSTVTHIGVAAFGGCSLLSDISLKDNANYKVVEGNLYDIEMTTLMAYASGSDKEEFVIPDTVRTIDDMAFYGCDAIVKIELPDNVSYIGAEAFAECSNLLYIVFSRDVAAWKLMEKGEGWDKGLEEMFIECSDSYCYPSGAPVGEGLEYVLSEDGSYYVVASAGTNNEADLVIPSKYNSKPVKSVEANSFDGVTTIVSVRFIEGIESIGENAFLNCTGIVELYLAETVKTIGNNAFSGCASIKTFVSSEALETIGDGAFRDCVLISEFTIASSVTSIGSEAFMNCTSLGSIRVPASVKTIGARAFENCTAAKTITLADGIKEIGEAAFRNCSAAEGTINIPKGLTAMGNEAFSGCALISGVVVAEGLTAIPENAFAGCEAIESLVIAKSVTSIAASAFNTCEKITSITFNGTIAAWTEVQSAENWAEAVAEDMIIKCSDTYCFLDGTFVAHGVVFTESFNKKFYTVDAIGEFDGEALIIPDKYNGLPVTAISASAFENATTLKSVVIMGSVTHIGSRAFAGCTSLESIVLPSTLTDIEAEAFEGCTALESITLPATLENIGENVFVGCSALAHIEYMGSSSAWSNVVKGEKWAEGVATEVVECVTFDDKGEKKVEEVSIVEEEVEDEE